MAAAVGMRAIPLSGMLRNSPIIPALLFFIFIVYILMMSKYFWYNFEIDFRKLDFLMLIVLVIGIVSALGDFLCKVKNKSTYVPGVIWREFRANRSIWILLGIYAHRLSMSMLIMLISILFVSVFRKPAIEIFIQIGIPALLGILFPFGDRVSGAKEPQAVNPALKDIWDGISPVKSSDLLGLASSFPMPIYRPIMDNDGLLGVLPDRIILYQFSESAWSYEIFYFDRISAIKFKTINGSFYFNISGLELSLYFFGKGALTLSLFKQAGFYHPLFDVIASRIDVTVQATEDTENTKECPDAIWTFTAPYRQF